MNVESIINTKVVLSHFAFRALLPTLTVAAILFAHWFVFTVVPSEQVMGAVQRVFYFHVSAAMVAYVFILALLFASVFYLVSKKSAWDVVADAAAGVSFLLCSIVLVTGMIWGHSAWNTWWRWEPRLVSFLVLWLILLSYVVLRGLVTERGGGKRNFLAVLGILAAINVPIVIFSIKLLTHSEQLHPEVIEQRGLTDSRYIWGLVISFVAVLLLSAQCFCVKLGNSLLESEIEELKFH